MRYCHGTGNISKGLLKMAKYSPLFSASSFQRGFRQFSICRALLEAFKFNNENKKEENIYLKRYADKIAALKSETSERTKQAQNESVKEKFIDGHQASCSNLEGLKFPVKNTISLAKHSSKKSLNSIMNLELLKDESAEEISLIWNQYHSSKDCLYAVIPKEAYYKMHSVTKEFPTFLYPVPKEGGYEFMLSQFVDNSCHFTSLLTYQTHKENAPVCLTITYYPDLCEEKGIVLMKGDHNEKLIKIHEAQFLANQLQMYYGKDDSRKKHMLLTFSKEPQKFNYRDLIHELERSVA